MKEQLRSANFHVNFFLKLRISWKLPQLIFIKFCEAQFPPFLNNVLKIRVNRSIFFYRRGGQKSLRIHTYQTLKVVFLDSAYSKTSTYSRPKVKKNTLLVLEKSIKSSYCGRIFFQWTRGLSVIELQQVCTKINGPYLWSHALSKFFPLLPPSLPPPCEKYFWSTHSR